MYKRQVDTPIGLCLIFFNDKFLSPLGLLKLIIGAPNAAAAMDLIKDLRLIICKLIKGIGILTKISSQINSKLKSKK